MAAAKKTKSNVGKKTASASGLKKFFTPQMIAVIVVVAIVGIILVYRSFASSCYWSSGTRTCYGSGPVNYQYRLDSYGRWVRFK